MRLLTVLLLLLGCVYLPAYGRVPPQPTPAPGSYVDTVVVTLSY